MDQTTGRKYVGTPTKRKNDPKLVTGHGCYVDDIRLPGTLHVAFVRSHHAHAEIVAIDTSTAACAAGVVTIVTGAGLTEWMTPLVSEEAHLLDRPLARHSLTPDRARFRGDMVAAVMADSAAHAYDAAELVEVEYRELPVVTNPEAAMASDAPILHPDWENNVAFHFHAESADVDAAFASARHHVRLTLVNQRLAPVYVEPKAVLANYDLGLEKLTVWASTQMPHTIREQIATVLGLPEPRVRVVAPDVGGAFGAKGRHASEYLFVAAASFRLGSPVKWVETRSEAFLASNHGRDQQQEIEAAITEDGMIEALRVRVLVNCGAYNAAPMGQRTIQMASGVYRIPRLRVDVYGVMTNTTPMGPYRGAGRPEAAYMVERLIEQAADQTGIDAIEIRRRNFIGPDEFPYQSATGVTYDSGNYELALDQALEILNLEQERQRVARLRAEGKLAGIGIAVFAEPAGVGWDDAEVRVSPTGAVTVLTGISPHGQGTETALAQLVADELGTSLEAVTVQASDTDVVPRGLGSMGSRSLAIGGGAVVLAAHRVSAKIRRIAGVLLEVAPEDVDLRDGRAFVVGTPDRSVALHDIAGIAHDPERLPSGVEPGLDERVMFEPEALQYPFGVHIAVVTIDPDTGQVSLDRFIAVDDCGTVINPQLVAGQVHGGVVQGIGQALWEEIVFDEQGQLVTGSLMDYAVPRAGQLPTLELDHTLTPSPLTPHGAKGVGEAGTTGSTPAVVNAVLDALRPLGVTDLDMPLTSEKIWRAIHSRGGSVIAS